ncbi:MAG: glycosyltransferase, partial [Burkholderiales bacterium]|nr:glycosyltransferase [Burkholderiales bacterium]
MSLLVGADVLSIPINIKNGEKYLERCLNSLYQFEDIILLDNYSTDKTLEIAKNY